MKPIPEAIVNRFANFNPTPEELAAVRALIAQIIENPDIGTPIPFDQEKYKNSFVAFTADGRWRVVYRILKNENTGEREVIIVAIDPQEDRR